MGWKPYSPVFGWYLINFVKILGGRESLSAHSSISYSLTAWVPSKVLPGALDIEASFNLQPPKENRMPIIAWLLGVPISVILILLLLGVF